MRPWRNEEGIYLYLLVARARRLAASTRRSLGGAFVSSALSRSLEIAAMASTAARNACSLALEGLLKPLILRTYCKEASRISSCVAGGSKLKRDLMLRHTGYFFLLLDRL